MLSLIHTLVLCLCASFLVFLYLVLLNYFCVALRTTDKKWKGFQKVYRMKYKPSKFKSQQEVTMNSSNDTDRFVHIFYFILLLLCGLLRVCDA